MMILRLAAALLLWAALYAGLRPAARWFAFSGLYLEEGTRLGSAVEFFVYDTPKVLLLLALVVFVTGVLRTFADPRRVRHTLARLPRAAAHGLAALVGVVTPFCSCSAVPLFIGFLSAGVPLGVTFSFLVAAPMVNEVALALLFGLFGWKVAALYAATGLAIAFVAGWVIGALHLEGHVEPWANESGDGEEESWTWEERLRFGRDSIGAVVSKVWPYIVGGIAVGAAVHGYVPDGMLAAVMGRQNWWSVPAAVLLGIPLYSNAAGVIPILQALLGKGAALGTALAFMMAVIGLSLPELVILRKVLKPRLLAVFVGVVGSGIMLVGYLMNGLGL